MAIVKADNQGSKVKGHTSHRTRMKQLMRAPPDVEGSWTESFGKPGLDAVSLDHGEIIGANITTKIATPARSESPSPRNHWAPICRLACSQPRTPMPWNIGTIAEAPNKANIPPRSVRHLGDLCAPTINVLAAAIEDAMIWACQSDAFPWRAKAPYQSPVYPLQRRITIEGIVRCRDTTSKSQKVDA